ncbi:MAG: hemolysin III family protein [Siculibacillus sp.]|nr:hemolysin III family protein [Siculibacillus sp.]
MPLPSDHPRLRKRPFSEGELIADGLIHAIAILAAIVGLAVLIGLVVARHGGVEITATIVYGFALLAMLGFSCAYNLVPASDLKWILRRFDHSAIYLMIAGTYTPLITLFDDGVWAWTLAIVVWTGAVVGIIVKLALPGRFDKLSIIAYVLLGLVVLAAIEPMNRSLPTASVVLVAVGGGLYISGIAFYLWKSLKFHNAIWHGFVVSAVFCHFAAITTAMVATSA